MMNKQKDCPLLIVMGQSNAHGHGSRLPGDLEINEGLKNVYGLPRSMNQAYGLEEVKWSGYTSCGMNLGEQQDHTWCLATEFARNWQNMIDHGEDLPDLYVIQISVGAQGIHKKEAVWNDPDRGRWIGREMNMWYPDREPVLEADEPLMPDISLYPLAVEILELAVKSIRKMGKNPVIIGLHWNQWEAEAVMGQEAVEQAYENYRRLWRGFKDALGMDYPLYLYRPLCGSDIYPDPKDVDRMSAVFDRFAAERGHTKILDVSKTAKWSEEKTDKGIFMDDGIHYLPWVHEWFAQQQLTDIQDETGKVHIGNMG